ncbi:MAG TPA: PaaI family thioesterase [Burkholderiaceae bacterium]|jgi:uncharacterized protein (TIGR00369 family)|nr:PaaI family thioesterase [Burkholderiaceae bacterium]
MLSTADLNERIKPLFPGTLGIELLAVERDKIVGALTVRRELCTAGDVLHGGAFMAFADTLGAIGTLVNLPAGARTTTIESKTNFLGAAPLGARVTGESTPLHRGRTTMVWQTRIVAESGKLLALVTQTQMVLPA